VLYLTIIKKQTDMNKLETLGLTDVTSKTQKKNGTVCYYDPITDCDYLSYSSGYVRRAYTKATHYSSRLHRTIYQLNPTKKTTRYYKGEGYPVTERILIHNPGYRIHLLSRAVVNYRKNSANTGTLTHVIAGVDFSESINQLNNLSIYENTKTN
tara:strand:+ start:79 stop:540 length:462 start_codon:yes stop_codon:yes gene_type:complete